MSGLGSKSNPVRNLAARLRGRHPRLSGTLRVHDPLGHDITIPLRGRAAVLTAIATGLTGEGEVWAVHTDPDATTVSLMISYGRTDSPDHRRTGLCPPGATVTLDGVDFTWHCPAGMPRATPAPATAEVPRPRPADTASATADTTPATARTPGNSAPSAGRDSGPIRNARAPLPRSGNSRSVTPTLRERVQAIVREFTNPPHR
ncbi:hypothetical protein [Actinoplanes siamensis]|uniref:hypothetical protein n=1 Tax=Actinoplanes siamensis TaxID=1223317 RepID=UPI001940BA7D|nr:hypothetical protein [Actinoplanes siamensis]